jgi:NADH-quinone oxidoreductase subunit H
VILVVTAFTVYAVLPIGRNMVVLDLDAGLLFFFAVGAASELAVFMAGWSSRNKYALLGAMRAVAQMVSYEIPLILATVSVVMITGTLSLPKIVLAQSTHFGFLPDWFVFTPWGFAGFLLFMIAANAEANRSPFDLPEGESEIIAGYFIEYSGFKFALFFLAEYLSLFAISGLGITLFLGGWNAPFVALEFIPSWAWFFLKLLALMCLFIWTRGTLPRLRQDQLMNFAWKFMIPMVLINLVAAALWHFIEGALIRWLVCGAIVVCAYLLLGRGLAQGKQITKRTYRFAE